MAMPRYVAKVKTPWDPQRAFAYMADLNNFAEWDPGVRKVVQTSGQGGGATAVFDVTVAGWPKDIVLAYHTVEYDEPKELLVVAKSKLLISEDRIIVEPNGKGSIVTYDASLRLNGALGIFDLTLKPLFNRIGSRAGAGLVKALAGTLV
jgi:hypothetical protein